VNGDRVNVRGQPSLDSEVLWQLAKGETVSVRDEILSGGTDGSAPHRWARIAMPAKTPVWVRSSFVSNGAVTASQLNVRSGPGEQFTTLARLPRGTKVSALAEKSGWLQIKPPADAASYVAADFLLTQKPAPTVVAAARSITPAAAAKPAPAQEPAPAPVASIVAPSPAELPRAASAPTLPTAAEPESKDLLASLPSPAKTGPDDTISAPSRAGRTTARSALSAGPGSSGASLLAVAPGSSDGLATQTPSAPPSVAASGSVPRTGPVLELEPGEKLNRFGISYRVGYHMTAAISRMAPFSSRADLGLSTAPGVSRVYDDGYVRLDSSGNAGNLTWNWGYSDAPQVSTADSITQHSFSGNFSSEAQRLGGGAPQHGLELTYNRQISHLGGKYDNGTWGVLAGFSRTEFSVQDSQTLSGTLTTTTDTYPLGGVIPPLAPYQGSFQGPGPLISSVPGRGFSSVANGATIIGQRDFEADIYGLRLGPYVEIPVGKYFSVSLSIGLAIGVVDSELRYNNTLVIPDSSVRLSQTGRGFDNQVVPGWYLDLDVNVPIYGSLSATGGFQFEGFDRYTHDSGLDRVQLNMVEACFFTVGLAYSF
jgi:SH3-like domain-containing protein